MARIIEKKYPIDSEARKAIGFGFPINGNAVFVPTYQTKDQIKANLVNYLLTNRGERVFNPDFGADLRSLLFENINSDLLDNLRDNIQGVISTQFPQIQVEDINFNVFEDENRIDFILKYRISSFGIEDFINIVIQ